MSKSKTTGSVNKIFDTHDDKIKNGFNHTFEDAHAVPIYDLDEEEIKKVIEQIKQLNKK